MADVIYAVVGKSDNKVRNLIEVNDAVPENEQWRPQEDEIAVKISVWHFNEWVWNGSEFTYTPPSPLTIME